jgi:enoyl-CoA hydratase/carnithine racemase
MDFKETIYTKEDGIATITLNRPEAMNAWSPTMLNEWVAAIEDAKYDDAVRVVIVTGAGRGFSAGADVKAMASHRSHLTPVQNRYETRLTYQKLPRAVEGLDKPYIAAVNGVAVGGGFDAASMADIRIASEKASFAINHLRVNRLSADGGYYFLARILGVSKTLELVLTCRFFDAQEALRMGYVSRVVPHDELMPATKELAEQLAKGPPIAMQMAKRLVYRAPSLSLNQHLEDIEAAMVINAVTEDFEEGPRAFREKRAPQYKGK